MLFSNFQVPSFSPELNGIGNENEPPKIAPGRYRHKRTDTSGSTTSVSPQRTAGLEGVTASGAFGTGKLGQFQYNPQQFAVVNTPPKTYAQAAVSPTENKVQSLSSTEKSDVPKRYKGRTNSSNSMEAGANISPGPYPGVTSPQDSRSPTQSNVSYLEPFGIYSTMFIANHRSMQHFNDTRPTSSGSVPYRPTVASRNEPPARSFTSADAVRRINNPSPLSRPMSDEPNTGAVPHLSSPYSPNPTITSKSPAVAAMAALNINDKQDSKNSKSRLRRAFSFGSSAELKRATEADAALDRARARQERFSTELDEEQDAVAKKQEAAGLGNSIYSGQGGVFAGSTDNLSISSTASSASLMLRKMGKGMKKGGRSIKGLFRPKSVIGVAAADGPSEASVGPITMINVEAERERINVNADPKDETAGGTGFPRLERNSIETGRGPLAPINGERSDTMKDSRRNIVGGEQDRQEVLAAVKRGILKRSGTSSPSGSPSIRPIDGSQDLISPSVIAGLERRPSPVPSTTNSEPRRTGHRRMDSHTLEGDDYFNSVPRITGNNHSASSLPGTPRSINRNISFSPRIQFHDAWSASEYDRRGEIATCNRLTPMLAQQIKEELNTFKMVSICGVNEVCNFC